MKQETLEEAAERMAKEHCSIRVNPNTTEFQIQQFIIKGAKWQERQKEQDKSKYSEEDMFTFSQWISHEDWVYLPSKDYWVNEEQEELEQKLSSKEILNLWFEQHKKK